MKCSLLSIRLAVSIILSCIVPDLPGQPVVFTEDFSGFTTGTHSSPSTYDVSGVLDTKTGIAGWTGFKVYSAGGEIKLGTSNIPGWIETPLTDLSGFEGDLFVKFDISGWPDDAVIVQVSINGSPLGDSLTPTNEFQTIELPLTDGVISGKIKFESLSKRFFLDNIQIVAQNATLFPDRDLQPAGVKVYPNPAGDIIHIDNLLAYNRLEISDLNGMILQAIDLPGVDKVEVSMAGLPPGLYIMKFVSVRGTFTTRFIKYQ